MKVETAGVMSRKSGSKFCAIVKSDVERTYVYDVKGDATLNQIELLAVKFAVLGITVDGAIVSTPSQYVSDMLQYQIENNEVVWTRTPKSNVSIIEEIRDLIIKKQIAIVYERNEQARNACKQ